MMEKMNFVMFCLGALSLAVGLVAMPYVSMLRNAFKARIKRRKNTKSNVYCDDLQTQINVLENEMAELSKQINNVAERLSTRERNRKYNIRRDIRDYLEELKNG